MSAKVPSQIPSRMVYAAGALVWRPINESVTIGPGTKGRAKDIQVLLVHRPRYGDWSWPKGKTEPKEHILTTAAREVEEETGIAVSLGLRLVTQRYRLGIGHTKEVHYWIGTPLSSEDVRRTRRPVVPATRREIDEARWVRASEARRLITRRGDRRLLDDLVARLTAGTLVTQTVVLLRHAKALSRSDWGGTDADRPLVRKGTAQATDLVPVLSTLGVEQIVSSSWRRCMATVEPYAVLADLKISSEKALTEDSYAADPRKAINVWDNLFSSADAPVVISMHRPLIPTFISTLKALAPSAVRRQLPNGKTPLHTGEIVVAHLAQPEGEKVLVGVERYRPTRIQ